MKLPETNVETAMTELVALDRDGDLLRRDVDFIDLRLADRVVVQLSPTAMEAREASLKKAGSRKSKPEKRI